MMGLAAALAGAAPLFAGGDWMEWIYRGLVILVIACPCALVISTPVSIVSGLTAAARNGVLVKGGVHLESAGRLRALAIDKTGTLTYGEPRVTAVDAWSEHPLARAILQNAAEQGLTARKAGEFRAVKGKGAEGVLDGRRFWIGSRRLLEERGGDTPEIRAGIEPRTKDAWRSIGRARAIARALEDAGHSVVVVVGTDDHVCGLIAVADGVREDARRLAGSLRRLGIRRVVMLTGDNEGTARAVARASGIQDYRAGLLPEDKVRAVEETVREFGSAAMVGDGVNDAPAMAASSLGIAMGASLAVISNALRLLRGYGTPE